MSEPIKKRGVSHRGCKNKGSNYEREVAEFITARTRLNVRRALLSGGGRHEGVSDLEGLEYVSAELKRTETFSIYAAMKQSIEAAQRSREVPVVITRRSGVQTGDSLVVMKLEDWTTMYESWRIKRKELDAGIRSPLE